MMSVHTKARAATPKLAKTPRKKSFDLARAQRGPAPSHLQQLLGDLNNNHNAQTNYAESNGETRVSSPSSLCVSTISSPGTSSADSNSSKDDREGCRSLLCDANGIIIAEMVYRCMVCNVVHDYICAAKQHYHQAHFAQPPEEQPKELAQSNGDSQRLDGSEPSSPMFDADSSARALEPMDGTQGSSSIVPTSASPEDEVEEEEDAKGNTQLHQTLQQTSAPFKPSSLISSTPIPMVGAGSRSAFAQTPAAAALELLDSCMSLKLQPDSLANSMHELLLLAGQQSRTNPTAFANPNSSLSDLRMLTNLASAIPFEQKTNYKPHISCTRSGLITCPVCNSTRFYTTLQRRYGQFTCVACYRFFKEFFIKPRRFECSTLSQCPLNVKNKCRACWIYACTRVYSVDSRRESILVAHRPVHTGNSEPVSPTLSDLRSPNTNGEQPAMQDTALASLCSLPSLSDFSNFASFSNLSTLSTLAAAHASTGSLSNSTALLRRLMEQSGNGSFDAKPEEQRILESNGDTHMAGTEEAAAEEEAEDERDDKLLIADCPRLQRMGESHASSACSSPFVATSKADSEEDEELDDEELMPMKAESLTQALCPEVMMKLDEEDEETTEQKHRPASMDSGYGKESPSRCPRLECSSPVKGKRSKANRAKPTSLGTSMKKSKARVKNWCCLKCANCLADDCGKCINCLDRPKFGGPFIRKQRCINKRCLMKGSKMDKNGCNTSTATVNGGNGANGVNGMQDIQPISLPVSSTSSLSALVEASMQIEMPK